MQYKPFSEFILRTPHKSFEWLLRLLEKNDLSSCLKDKAVMDAIYIASPVLYGEIIKLFNDSNSMTQQEEVKVKLSFIKYLTRMATRCTPYGLFSACSIGEIDRITTNSAIITDNSIKGVARLDTSILCMISNLLLKIPEVRHNVIFYPNNTIYRVNSKFRYVDFKYFYGHRAHHISSSDYNIYLERLLRKIERGAKFEDMLHILKSMDVDEESAKDYINALIDNTVIISDLDVTISGAPYFDRLYATIKNISSEDLNPYNALFEYIAEINAPSRANESKISQLKHIERQLKDLSFPKEVSNILQVDSFRNCSTIKLGDSVIKELESVVNLLLKFSQPFEHPDILRFRQNFSKRYEDAEIPLLNAIDSEIGIGYPCNNGIYAKHPIIDSFKPPVRDNSTPSTGGTMDLIRELLIKKMMIYMQGEDKEIVITEEELAAVKGRGEALPSSIYLFFQLIKDKEGDLLINLKHAAPSGASFITRFYHLDGRIEKLIKEIVKKEQEIEQGVILAEIIHLSDTRVGNIMTRPHLREYEIPYLTNSTLPHLQQIPLSDIVISVKGNRIVLRSRRLGKEIIPCLTNAHNYSNNPTPVYRFLCDLQHQGQTAFNPISWSFLGSYFSYTPRVRYKNIILLPATWYLGYKKLKELGKLSDNELIEQIEKLREEVNLPQLALFPKGDNVLFIDFKNLLTVRAFISAIKDEVKITLQEFLYDAEMLAVRDMMGEGYLNECIVPFYLSK